MMRLAHASLIAVIAASIVAGCKSSSVKTADTVAPLKVTFADTTWNGKTIPSGQQCSRDGGTGATPALVVSNIPADANAIIVAYNDASYAPLSNDGGHGKIGYWIDGGGTRTVPSVPGESNDMPEGAFVDAKNRAARINAQGYLPPCSGGRGNSYFADVMAVKRSKNGDETLIVGEGRIELGQY